MKRGVVLGSVLAVAMGSMAVAAQQAAPSAKAMAATRIEKVKENLYVITGSSAGDNEAFSGGNTAVFVTADGVTLVDTKLAGWGPRLVELVKTVTAKPITRIINTHAHGDHTGSNPHFASVERIVQQNTRTNMVKMDEYKGDNAKLLPTRTYTDRLTVGAGRDAIELYYFGRGHTSGDSFVVFPALRTMHVGDMFAWKALPFIDPGNGGSVIEHPKSLARALAAVKNVDTIINGHIPVSRWQDLQQFAEFTADFVAYAERSLQAGKSVDQAAKEYTVPARFPGYVAAINPAFGGARANLQIAYDELRAR